MMLVEEEWRWLLHLFLSVLLHVMLTTLLVVDVAGFSLRRLCFRFYC